MGKTKINMMTEKYTFDITENEITEGCKHALKNLLSDVRPQDCFWETDTKAKEKLDSFFKSDEDEQLFLAGATGTGKTHFLKEYFSLPADENFWIKENRMLIFFSGDGNGMVENHNIVEYFAGELEKICVYYRRHYMGARRVISEDYGRFYNFVLETKKEALSNPWLSGEKEGTACAEVIKRLKRDKPFTYYMMELKYCLLLSKKITDVTVVCDNIDNREMYVEVAIKVKNCICNYERDKYFGYRVKTIFVMNEETYWEIYDKKNSSGKVVRMNQRLDMQALIDSRFQQAKTAVENGVKESAFGMSSLLAAKDMLDYLNSRFNQKYYKMILGLSLNNKNLALHAYKKIVFNSTWVRKERFSYAKDVFDKNKDYLFNNITCIRALACGNNKVFNPREDGDHFIPNILYNTEEEEFGLFILLLMKYFVRQHGIYAYREDAGRDILNICEQIWGRGSAYENFEIAIDYLCNMKVLEERPIRKGIMADGRDRRLRITERGIELWDMLRSDSLLMELCREDCYRSPDSNMESSYLLLNTERQDLIFEDLLAMVREVCKHENELYQMAVDRGHSEEYISEFGKKRMAFYLLEGISKSITYSISRSNDDLKVLRDGILDEVTAAR